MNRVYIIAEAGVNHNGDIKIAKKLIEEAKHAGVDAVKFQTFVSKNLVSSFAKKADYQKQTTSSNESQLKMLEKLELTFTDFEYLKDYAIRLGIDFISTPFDIESLNFLKTIDMPYWKIPSGEITNRPFLEKIAETKKPIILSTGMSTVNEVREALEIFKDYNKDDIILLHCNTEYPTPLKDVNLKAMLTLKDEFQVTVGYSDHTKGIEVAIAAVAMGAKVIEKHFTLDKNMEGPDHMASLEPNELKHMVKGIRNIEAALGTGIKEPSESEAKNIEVARKSIVAKIKIKKGEKYTIDNITTKRPGNGVSPMRWNEFIGKESNRDYKVDELIQL